MHTEKIYNHRLRAGELFQSRNGACTRARTKLRHNSADRAGIIIEIIVDLLENVTDALPFSYEIVILNVHCVGKFIIVSRVIIRNSGG